MQQGSDWIVPPPDAAQPPPPRRPRHLAAIAAGVLGGAGAGVLIAWAIGAGATTNGTGQTPAAAAGQAAYGTAGTAAPGPWHHRMAGNVGTVTAVGAKSVTIKTTSGTKTYAVTSST